jgi:hypothetical protein
MTNEVQSSNGKRVMSWKKDWWIVKVVKEEEHLTFGFDLNF